MINCGKRPVGKYLNVINDVSNMRWQGYQYKQTLAIVQSRVSCSFELTTHTFGHHTCVCIKKASSCDCILKHCKRLGCKLSLYYFQVFVYVHLRLNVTRTGFIQMSCRTKWHFTSNKSVSQLVWVKRVIKFRHTDWASSGGTDCLEHQQSAKEKTLNQHFTWHLAGD